VSSKSSVEAGHYSEEEEAHINKMKSKTFSFIKNNLKISFRKTTTNKQKTK